MPSFFVERGLENFFCPGRLGTVILPISTSCVAGMMLSY
jgi:hypothetical protein